MEPPSTSTLAIISAFLVLGGGQMLLAMRNRQNILDRRGEGIQKVQRWLEGSEEACIDALGMKAATFQRLVSDLTGHVNDTAGLPSRLKIALTLYMLRKSVSYRTLRDVFQVSLASLSFSVNEVIDALAHPDFYYLWVKQPTPSTLPLDEDTYNNPKFTALTKRSLGALDGCHILCTPPAREAAAYRNRKGEVSFNVLAAVTLDGLFSFVYAGWEGSAHDQRVLNDALSTGGMKIPEGWFYLADAGYSMADNNVLVPFRGVRYHLREQAAAGQRPTNQRELYNLRHSQVRNVIERGFGRLKRKFKILKTGSTLPITTQRDTIYACCALLNFMMLQGEEIDADRNVNENLAGDEPAATSGDGLGGGSVEEEVDFAEGGSHRAGADRGMKGMRERIAKALWKQYQDYRRENGYEDSE